MSCHTLSEFTDKVNEIMPIMMREFMRYHVEELCKTKITFPQVMILHYLNGQGGLKMSDMAKAIHASTAAMTGMVDRLVRDGYVARSSDPLDRRIVIIKLTNKGTKIVARMDSQKKKMVMDIFGNISEREREEYLKILIHIHKNIKSRKDNQ